MDFFAASFNLSEYLSFTAFSNLISCLTFTFSIHFFPKSCRASYFWKLSLLCYCSVETSNYCSICSPSNTMFCSASGNNYSSVMHFSTPFHIAKGLCVCVCVCVCMYIYTHTYIHIYIIYLQVITGKQKLCH